MNWSCEKLWKWTGDALVTCARPRLLPCAARALGVSVIAYFHISTIPQCAARAAPVPRQAVEKTPAVGEFKLLASRRFVLDNELKLAELVPGTVMAPGVQHPLVWSMDGTPPQVAFEDGIMRLSAVGRPAEGAVFVSGWLPGAHYSADFESLSDGAAAVLVWRDEKEDVLLRIRAEPGKPVAFEERVGGKTVAAKLEKPMVVPAPPFRLSGVVAGPTMLIAARKDGIVSYLGAVTFADSPDLRARRFLGSMKFGVGASLPANGRAVVSHAEMALTAGVGQADFRIVTDGPGCRPYFENGRMFCTFSARAGFKYVKSVASFDPALLDFRMEGVFFTNYGDGDDLLRNDAVNHLFYDRCSKTWKACGVGWSVASNNLDPKTRRGSGIVAMECTKNPLHGITVFQAHPLLMEGGLKSEDPYFMFDETTNKWRFATSTFAEKGLRPCLWEADKWDGPYRRIAGPGLYDSTGCQIMDFGGSKFVMTANVKQMMPVYSYPSLDYCGELRLDIPPFGKESPNGRVFMAFAELPDGYPFRYLMIAMDRKNFPGMPDPNWTYGSIYFYGMNPGTDSRE